MQHTLILDSTSAAETEALATALAHRLIESSIGNVERENSPTTGSFPSLHPFSNTGLNKSGILITLEGELGAGKTVFVRGLARGLGIPTEAITSPTYVLQHIYRGGRLLLYHMDAYRIAGGAREFEASGLLECLDDPQAVVCLEWPERLAGFQWPTDRIKVEIEHCDMERRRIKLASMGPRAIH